MVPRHMLPEESLPERKVISAFRMSFLEATCKKSLWHQRRFSDSEQQIRRGIDIDVDSVGLLETLILVVTLEISFNPEAV